MLPLWIKLTRGSDMPDMIVMSDDYFTFFEQSQTALKRYTADENGQGGMVSMKYKSADVFFDSSGGIPSAHAYFLNTDYIGLVIHQDADMTLLDDVQSINQDAMVKACATYAPGKTIPQCVAIEESHKPEGGDFVAYARKQLVDLRQFVIEHNVVTVPGEEEAMVKQSPPYNAQNGAYIDPTPPFAKELPAFYNIAAPDPTWSKAKQLDYIPGKANLLFTSVHEVWPGHFLQFLHSARAESMFGKVYVGYAFAEGWAHYAEEMMWDEGLGNGDPETHIGQLYNATLRNVRFLSAIGMHTKGMTLEQSKKMFIDEGYQGEGTAEQQAARGAYDPAYLNYTMGKLMIRKLRDDYCAAHPELVTGGDVKTCWKPFHDAFLAFGGPPIPLVRGAMMQTAPKAVF